MAENLIELKNVKLAYNKDYCALYDITLDIQKGEHIAIVGPKESGKTAILRVIAGLEKIQSGECYIKNTDVNKIDFAKDVDLGFLFTKPTFFERKSVYKNLLWALKVRKVNKNERDAKIQNVLALFGIESIQKQKLKKLCNTDRRLVQIARLALRPTEIILVDDIFTECENADTSSRVKDALQKLFATTPKNKTLIFACENIKEYKEFVDRIVNIELGSLKK